MFPLAMGVVMALGVMGNGMYAAQQKPLPLNERFFGIFTKSALVIEKPKLITEPESEAFTKLKKNELERAACRGNITRLLQVHTCSPDLYQQELKRDGQLIEKSVCLFLEYKKHRGIESPTRAAVPVEVEKRAGMYQEYLQTARILLADDEDTIAKCKAKNKPVAPEVRTSLTTLIAKLHRTRMNAPANWRLYNQESNSMVKEQDIAMYHMHAFKHYMLLEAQFNDLQKDILKNF